jgi:hypothetical protein
MRSRARAAQRSQRTLTAKKGAASMRPVTSAKKARLVRGGHVGTLQPTTHMNRNQRVCTHLGRCTHARARRTALAVG